MATPMPVIDIVAYSVDSVRYVQRGGMAGPCIHAGRTRIARRIPILPRGVKPQCFFGKSKKLSHVMIMEWHGYESGVGREDSHLPQMG
ncbi:hypothetical protein [Komagataeibacter swingsii]|nr:hypothetical protein [Komagataeibacter swingsii]